MDEKKLQDLKSKVIDYKRFSYILLSLCGFLSMGLVLPTITLDGKNFIIVIALIFSLLIGAIAFHRSAMNYERKIYNEES